jgi:sugar (pentulose or hexulose) kinase
VAHVLPEVLAQQPRARRLLSVPGYLAWRLTGRQAVTASELSALGLWTAENRPAASVEPLLRGVELAAPGASVGPCRAHPGADVFLAGTDEQASHHGAGVGHDGAWGLATATFWSLTAPAGPEPPSLPPEVRYLPALPPYHAAVSVIGYRWGPYLQEALSGQSPAVPEHLPRWAAGEVLACLRGGGPVDRARLLQAAAADIRGGMELLARVGHAPPPTALRVHGGGLTGLGSFARELLQEVGLPWVEVPGDATQLGCCLVGMGRP